MAAQQNHPATHGKWDLIFTQLHKEDVEFH